VEAKSGLDIGKTNKLGYLICLINLGAMVLSVMIVIDAEKASQRANIDFNNIEQIATDWAKSPYTEIKV